MTVRKVSEVNVRRYAARLGRVLARATVSDVERACAWYADAREVACEVARRADVSVECGAAIVAAFSPRCPWGRNIVLAVDFAEGRTVRTLGASIRAAEAAVDAYRQGADPIATLRGPKTNAFASNIAGDLDPVTVDVWICRAAGIGSDAPTVVQYREVSAAMRRVARRYGLSPAVAQAAVWIVVRGSAD